MHGRYKVQENPDFAEVVLSKPQNRNESKEMVLEMQLTNGMILRCGNSEQFSLLSHINRKRPAEYLCINIDIP
jgi:hypothetical protein